MTTTEYRFPMADTPAAEIEARNAWFAKLTPAEQRVELAREVLRMLDAEVLRTEVDSGYGDIEFVGWVAKVNQEALLSRPKCVACARGGLLLARIRGFNQKEMRDGGRWVDVSEEDTTSGLRGIFPKAMLEEIEAAFEGWNITRDFPFNRRNLGKLARAGAMYRHLDANARLRAICVNIIENGGTFVIGEAVP